MAVLLANGIAGAGLRTEVAVMMSGGEGEYVLKPQVAPDVALSFAGPPMGSRKRELARGLPHIIRRMRAFRPDLVLATSNNMGLVTAYAALWPRRHGPCFAFKTTNPVIRPRDKGAITQWYRRRLYGFIFARFDRVLVLTEAERRTLAAMYPACAGKFHVVANPYVTDAMLADFTREQPIADAPRTILTLARMMPQKRLDLLLDAFARLPAGLARLVILGEGPERAMLEERARELGIADRLDMPGFTSDVVPWLRRADLFVLSSHYEGLPAVVLEALAANLPVVTTDCFHGAADLLAGAARCAVVARGDVAALADAMAASLAVKHRPTGLRAIARPYGMDAAIASHIAALRPLLERRKG